MAGFAFTHLLGYWPPSLAQEPRRSRLYRICDGPATKGLESVSTRPIPSELITRQHDQMIKYARDLQLGPPTPNRSCAGSATAARNTRRSSRSSNRAAPGRTGVHLRVPHQRDAAPPGPRMVADRRAVKFRQRRDPLRQGLRPAGLRPREPTDRDAGRAPAAVRVDTGQHPPRRPGPRRARRGRTDRLTHPQGPDPCCSAPTCGYTVLSLVEVCC